MPIESKECFTNLTTDGQLYEIYLAAQSGVATVTATAPLTSSGGANPNISTSMATNRILGRTTAGTGAVEEITVGTGLSLSAGSLTSTGITGSVGAVDNAILRADVGTGIVQNSGLIIEDAVVGFAVTGVASTDIITATGSAFANGQPVRFTALTGGAGLNTTTNYYVINVSGATFQVSTSVGGGASLFTTDITAGTLVNGHSASTNVTLSENTTATNSDLVLTPKGTGAFILGPKPDGTATGGNARGARAVDLQSSRTASAQVASGNLSVVSGGSTNTASGDLSVVSGGDTNTASAFFSVVSGGGSNTASGNLSVVSGGGSNAASGSFSVVSGGDQSLANRYGMQAHANGRFAAQGDAQRARFVLRCKTTTNAAVEMALDGSTTYLTIPSGKVMYMNIKVVGTKSDGTAVATYERQYAVKNVAASSSEVYAPITIGTDNAAGTTIEVATVDAGDYVRIRPTGIASEIWRWVASVDAVEVAYGA
jgi:hypothetical protein